MFKGLLILTTEFVFWPLGNRFNVEDGVFLTYSSFIGANLEDLILFDWLLIFFCIPLPMILICIGWKSNCLIDNETYEVNVVLDVGINDI